MVSAALTHPENRGDGVWWKLEAGERGFEPGIGSHTVERRFDEHLCKRLVRIQRPGESVMSRFSADPTVTPPDRRS